MEKESDFGKGFLYPLALFLAHAGELRANIETYQRMSKNVPCPELYSPNHAAESWLNAAADHLYEFMPELAPKHLLEKCNNLKMKCLKFRDYNGHEEFTPAMASEFIGEAKSIFLELDLHNDVPAICATYG